MRYLILAPLILALSGCSIFELRGQMQTITAHSVINDGGLDEPIGFFQITQSRWVSEYAAHSYDARECDRQLNSDIVVTFTNTTGSVLNFNFNIAGRGWSLKDAVIDLKPQSTYTSQRIVAPYNSLDYWRVEHGRISARRIGVSQETRGE
jgi:hypothetical protein